MALLRRFLTSTTGNTGVIFAISAVPLIIATGSAIDMVRANNAQTVLQKATDAAAFAGMNARTMSADQIQTLVTDYLNKNDIASTFATITEIQPNWDSTSGVFTVRVTGKINTTLMSFAGINALDVTAFSQVAAGGRALEVALVLDNTGSMAAGGRLDALKQASRNLVQTVTGGSHADGYTRIGIVPFAEYVNVGVDKKTAGWLTVPPDAVYASSNTCTYTYPHKTGCHFEDVVSSYDGVSTTTQVEYCTSWGTPDVTCGPTSTTISWAGCVGSRDEPLDEMVANPAKLYPGVLGVSCPSAVQALTNDVTVLESKINGLWAQGDTYIPAGLLWGWNLLDASEPFTGAKTSEELEAMSGVKAIVLMTDGDNTRSASYPTHDNIDKTKGDAKTAALCSAIKAAGIKIFTVALNVTNQSSKDMLTDCASEPAMAFDVNDNTAMMAAFDSIAGSLAAIRLTR